MGEVYRARDTRVGRDVAIKVSSERFSDRFDREARAIAALNHPNICQLYDVGPNYLVMELVEGESPTGPLPVEEALRIARQIAAALEAAHEERIVHRDLKPANIKVRPDGTVKVLDFGLAKTGVVAPSASASDSPTISMAATQAGVILGTAAYMSPEQARGRPVDRRADIWAFGVVLCELLTGRQLFAGDDITEILASVVKEKPDLRGVPAEVRPLIERCLEKDPRKRLRDIGDVELLLEAAPVAERPAPGRSRLRWVVEGGLAVIAVLLGFGWWHSARPAPLRPLMRLRVELGQGMPVWGGNTGEMLALSPDGTRLAVVYAAADGKPHLGIRLLDQSQITPLAGAEEAFTPFFSPDSQWIGFFTDGKLKKVSVNGGAPVTLCDAPNGRGASWGDDGNIIAALNNTGPLSRVPSSGGSPVPVTKLAEGEVTHRWPQMLPGSQAVLFTAHNATNSYSEANIDVASLKTGERKTVQRGGYSGRYLATPAGARYLIYLRQNTLFAAPFDLGKLAVTGAPTAILSDVGGNVTGGGEFACSETGTFVYFAGNGARPAWPILWLESSGKTRPLRAEPGYYSVPRFSPDGKRLAFAVENRQGGGDIWVQDLERDTASRLTTMHGLSGFPVWTPDGKSIIFRSSLQSNPGLYGIRSDGSGEAQRLSDGTMLEAPNSVSPDGKRLAFTGRSPGGNYDIFTAAIEGDPGGMRLGKPELFVRTPLIESDAAFSPDGRWLAYGSTESGTEEVYVRPFRSPSAGQAKEAAQPGSRWQISAGGAFPVWSRNGRELFYKARDRRIMVAGYTTSGDSFVAGKPRVWSEIRLRNEGRYSTYDVAPEGQRIAAVAVEEPGTEQKPVTQVNFLLNFLDELERRLGR